MLVHLLKFLGLLFLMSVLARFVPFGTLIGSAIVLVSLWKLTE